MTTKSDDDIEKLVHRAKVKSEALAKEIEDAASAGVDKTREIALDAFEMIKSVREKLAKKLD